MSSSPSCPDFRLLSPARATDIVDEEAAATLAEKDYYRWIFAIEPDWEEYR